MNLMNEPKDNMPVDEEKFKGLSVTCLDKRRGKQRVTFIHYGLEERRENGRFP